MADLTPGDAILHLGGQYHSARAIESGERSNLILWLMGKHDVVRIAPHEEAERLTAEQRWGAFAREQKADSFADLVHGAGCSGPLGCAEEL